AECPRGSELTQLVAHHVLGDVDGYVFPPVVYRNGVAHHLRKDRGGPRPRPDYALFAGLIHLPNLLQKTRMGVWALLRRASHRSTSSPLLLTTPHDQSVGLLTLLARPDAQSRLAPGRHGTRHADRRVAFAAAVRVIDRVH